MDSVDGGSHVVSGESATKVSNFGGGRADSHEERDLDEYEDEGRAPAELC